MNVLAADRRRGVVVAVGATARAVTPPFDCERLGVDTEQQPGSVQHEDAAVCDGRRGEDRVGQWNRGL